MKSLIMIAVAALVSLLVGGYYVSQSSSAKAELYSHNGFTLYPATLLVAFSFVFLLWVFFSGRRRGSRR